MPLRFHFDEHLPHAVADGLLRHAVDVTTSTQANLLGQDDPDQLGFAISDGRVLVTHDEDFTRIHAENPQHNGICYCHQEKVLHRRATAYVAAVERLRERGRDAQPLGVSITVIFIP